MTGRLQSPGKPCAKDFRTKPYGTGDGRRLRAEDGPVCGNGVEDGIAVEMAVEMGARKRIKGGGEPPRGAFGRPGAVSRGLRDCIFGGIEKKWRRKRRKCVD